MRSVRSSRWRRGRDTRESARPKEQATRALRCYRRCRVGRFHRARPRQWAGPGVCEVSRNVTRRLVRTTSALSQGNARAEQQEAKWKDVLLRAEEQLERILPTNDALDSWHEKVLASATASALEVNFLRPARPRGVRASDGLLEDEESEAGHDEREFELEGRGHLARVLAFLQASRDLRPLTRIVDRSILPGRAQSRSRGIPARTRRSASVARVGRERLTGARRAGETDQCGSVPRPDGERRSLQLRVLCELGLRRRVKRGIRAGSARVGRASRGVFFERIGEIRTRLRRQRSRRDRKSRESALRFSSSRREA